MVHGAWCMVRRDLTDERAHGEKGAVAVQRGRVGGSVEEDKEWWGFWGAQRGAVVLHTRIIVMDVAYVADAARCKHKGKAGLVVPCIEPHASGAQTSLCTYAMRGLVAFALSDTRSFYLARPSRLLPPPPAPWHVWLGSLLRSMLFATPSPYKPLKENSISFASLGLQSLLDIFLNKSELVHHVAPDTTRGVGEL